MSTGAAQIPNRPAPTPSGEFKTRIASRVVFLVLWCGIAYSVSASEPSTSASASTEVVDGFHAALAEGDLQRAKSLLAPDVLIMESGETERSARDYEAAHLPADIQFSSTVDSTLMHRTVRIDGSFAWVASEYRLKARVASKSNVQAFASTETMVLHRHSGQWLIVHIHWSSKKLKD